MKRILFAALLICASQVVVAQLKPLTMEEAVLGQFRQFYPEHLNQLQWLPKSDTYVYVKNDTLYQGLPEQKIDKILLTVNDLNTAARVHANLKSMPQMTWLDPTSFYFEEGGKYLQYTFKIQQVAYKATLPEEGENPDYHGKSGNLAYTKANNLFVNIGNTDKQLTTNKEGIVSGQSISRNEYGISKGTFWSPDGSRLAFYQKDETKVTNYPLINYKETPASIKNIKYPMSGGASEIVSVGIYHVAADKIFYLSVEPADRMNDQFYVTNLTWSPDGNRVYLIWMNRMTTEMQLRAYDANSGKLIKTLITETDIRWVEPDQPITFIPDGSGQFLWYSWRDGFHNYYLYDAEGTLLRQTKATFELTDIIGFSSNNTKMFVHGTGSNPTEMMAYSIELSDMSMTKLTPAAGYHNVVVSGTGKFILDTYSSLTVPNRTELSSGGRMIRTLIVAKDPLKDRAIGKTELFTINANNGNVLHCRLIKPSNFDPNKKYPVVVYVYNGPHVQLVTNTWLGGSSLWMNKLAEEGYLVFTVDGHGSAHRGKNFEQIIHRQLGTQELEDQMSGVEWLRAQSFVDSERMAIHGWSYGGFMTTGLMLRKPGTFKVGVAGGPVIDWNLYEVMYTERYMDTPAENPEGYKTADLTGYVDRLSGKLLMIHGADDDVVVMQHNMRFLKATIDKKVQVDFFVYPGHAHNVRGVDRVHLMNKVIDYIKLGLKK